LTYGIRVKFQESEKSYTYASKERVPPGTLVVVELGNGLLEVVTVEDVFENFEPKKGFHKWIVGVVVWKGNDILPK
jgi:hypothetical protein